MEGIVNNLVSEIYKGMKDKLDILWPEKDNFFPPEANLVFELARLGEKFHYFSYGEANVGKHNRRDMILINSKDNWICQVEVKLVNSETINEGSVVEDLKRVMNKDELTNFINKYAKDQNIKCFRKYGLFIGGDISHMFSWWNTNLLSESIKQFYKKYISDVEEKHEELRLYLTKSTYGIVPKDPEETKLWLVYALFNLDKN